MMILGHPTLPRPELRPQIHGGAPRAEAPNAARPRSREASGPVPRVSPRARRGEGTTEVVCSPRRMPQRGRGVNNSRSL